MRPVSRPDVDDIQYDEEVGKGEDAWDNNMLLAGILRLGTRAQWYFDVILNDRNKGFFGNIERKSIFNADTFFEKSPLDPEPNQERAIRTIYKATKVGEIQNLGWDNILGGALFVGQVMVELWNLIDKTRGASGTEQQLKLERQRLGTQLVKTCNFFWWIFGGNPWEKKRDKASSGRVVKYLKLTSNLSGYYSESRNDLLQSFDSFCSYCGMKLTILSAVEHMLPKADFPIEGLSWDNFLISCGACNSKKGDNPSRDLCIDLNNCDNVRLPKSAKDPWLTPWTEAEMTKNIKNEWVWVDEEDVYTDYKDFFSFALYRVAYNQRGEREQEFKLTALVNYIINIANAFQIDDSQHPAVVIKADNKEYRVELLVVPPGNSSIRDAAKYTHIYIKNFNLNRNDAEVPDVGDHRIKERTIIWLRAIQKAKRILGNRHYAYTVENLKEDLLIGTTKEFWAVQMDAYEKTGLLTFLKNGLKKEELIEIFYECLKGTRPPEKS